MHWNAQEMPMCRNGWLTRKAFAQEWLAHAQECIGMRRKCRCAGMAGLHGKPLHRNGWLMHRNALECAGNADVQEWLAYTESLCTGMAGSCTGMHWNAQEMPMCRNGWLTRKAFAQEWLAHAQECIGMRRKCRCAGMAGLHG